MRISSATPATSPTSPSSGAEPKAAPFGEVRAKLARAYVTGNHEYFGEAQGRLDRMRELGWETLHNRHVVVERGGSRLVVSYMAQAIALRALPRSTASRDHGTFEQVSVMSLVIEKGRVAEPCALVFTPLHAAPLLRLRLRRASKSGVEVMHAHCPAAEHLRLLP